MMAQDPQNLRRRLFCHSRKIIGGLDDLDLVRLYEMVELDGAGIILQTMRGKEQAERQFISDFFFGGRGESAPKINVLSIFQASGTLILKANTIT